MLEMGIREFMIPTVCIPDLNEVDGLIDRSDGAVLVFLAAKHYLEPERL